MPQYIGSQLVREVNPYPNRCHLVVQSGTASRTPTSAWRQPRGGYPIWQVHPLQLRQGALTSCRSRRVCQPPRNLNTHITTAFCSWTEENIRKDLFIMWCAVLLCCVESFHRRSQHVTQRSTRKMTRRHHFQKLLYRVKMDISIFFKLYRKRKILKYCPVVW